MNNTAQHFTCTSLESLCDACRAEYVDWLNERRTADTARELRALNIATRRRAEAIALAEVRARIRAFLAKSLAA